MLQGSKRIILELQMENQMLRDRLDLLSKNNSQVGIIYNLENVLGYLMENKDVTEFTVPNFIFNGDKTWYDIQCVYDPAYEGITIKYVRRNK